MLKRPETSGHAAFIIESSLGKVGCEWNTKCPYGEGILQLNTIDTPNIGNDYSIVWTDIIDVRKSLRTTLLFSEIEGTGNMLRLEYASSNPFMSQFILENIINQFAQLKKEWDKDDAAKKQEYIAQTLDKLKKRIDDAANKLIQFQKSTDTFLPDKKTLYKKSRERKEAFMCYPL